MMLVAAYHPDMSVQRLERTEEVLQYDAVTITSASSSDFYKNLASTLRTWKEQSSLFQTRKSVSCLNDKLSEISGLAVDWDSYGAPAPTADTITQARDAIQFLWSRNLLPEVAAPSAEGGTVLYFSSGPQKAFLEFLNEGEVVLAQYSKDDEPNIRTLQNGLQDLDDNSVAEIRRHLLSAGTQHS